MSKQYNSIGASYDKVKILPGNQLERYNFTLVTKPFYQQYHNVKILDLACGSGYYTRLILSWGANNVVGVDISEAMIKAAKDQTSASKDETVQFILGDCSQPQKFPGGPFDIVMGNFLLNYAPDESTLAGMLGNVAENLSNRGVFVGICPTGMDESEIQDWKAETEKHAGFPELGIQIGDICDVQEGYRNRVTIRSPGEHDEVSFEVYHLTKETHERAARHAGLTGKLNWINPIVPNDEQESMEECGVPLKFWEDYLERPHFSILVIKK